MYLQNLPPSLLLSVCLILAQLKITDLKNGGDFKYFENIKQVDLITEPREGKDQETSSEPRLRNTTIEILKEMGLAAD